MASNYDKHIFRQLEDVLKKCDNLSQEIKDIKKVRETLIENFINNLPDRFKKIPNYEKIVRDTLEQTEKRIKEINERSR